MKIKREVKVGIFALATLLALYWGFNFLKGSDLFHRYNTYYATYDQVNGMQKSAGIFVKGYKIGVVSDIKYEPEVSDEIVLEFNIRSKYKIPDNSKARIFSDGLLGNKAIEIVMGTSGVYLEDGDTLRAEADKDFLEVAGSELEFLKQKVNVLTNDISVTLGNINTLLEGNQVAINTTMNNLASMTSTLNGVVQREAGAIGDVISSISELSVTLKNNAGKIENIIGNIEGVTDSLATGLPSTINGLTSTLEEFNAFIANVNAGEGSLGKLIADEQLYDALVTASENLGTLLEDIQAHPGRYVQFSVFGKKDK